MKSIWSNLGAALVQILVMANLVIMGAYGAPQVPCYFIFGDSIADNGNSNSARTDAKADYSPYGADFPSGPTGRFNNGKTIVDVVSGQLGFENYIKPFATANDQDILSGVNYAFSSAGILEKTGSSMGEVMSFKRQVRNHIKTVQRLSKQLGSENTAAYLNQCLYSVGMGTNDYLENYNPSNKQYTPEQFADLLMEEYAAQIEVLYKEGARKFVLFQLDLMGCYPARLNGSHCTHPYKEVDRAIIIFNQRMFFLPGLRHFPDAEFIYINSVKISHDVYNSMNLHFRDTCCPVSSDGQCVPGGVPCGDSYDYMFWDGYHTSDFYNTYYGETAYSQKKELHVLPYDIQTLIGHPQGGVAAAE